MSEPITPQISDRICKHMNDDHADAIVLYAKAFGGATNATAAKMTTIDPQGMDLAVQVDGTTTSLRIQFDHELKDAEDAHHTLIDMVKQARTRQATH
jgi:putative heme iron utilization protein